jgi:tetratricopeptide (TPR) repeat protein
MDARDVEDAFFRYEGDLLELSDRALSESPSARIHILRAAAARLFGLALDPLTELSAARDLPRDPADESLASAFEVLITKSPYHSVDRFGEHATVFPDDLLGAYFRFSSLVMSGVPGNREQAMAFVEADARRLSGNWKYDSMLAMVREEQRRYDDARALADRTLADQPGCAPAAHVITHVNYETGEHEAGITWLDEWSRDRDFLFYRTHFPWHNALHALALGDIEAALARFNDQIGPAAVVDAGSLLWRCRLASAEVHDRGVAAAAAAAPVVKEMPTAFALFNGCLALAAAGDVVGLADVVATSEADARPAFADLIAPIARGLLAMVEGRADDAASFIQPLADDLPRIGGSDAQREVIEDTLLRALVAAGRAEEATALLRARLERRPHALDCQLLAAASAH